MKFEIPKVRLFRGIALPSQDLDQTIESIQSGGLIFSDQSRWQSTMPDPAAVRAVQDELRVVPGSVRENLRLLPAKPASYACGDFYGGIHYALKHSYSADTPSGIVVEFEVPLSDLCVDGKDFLYTAFQNHGISRIPITDARMVLVRLFGEAVIPYLEQAVSRREQIDRIGICDLACHDVDVISAHAQNRVIIQGRYGTRFCSAFQFPFPVLPQAIFGIHRPSGFPSFSEFVTLDSIR